MRYFRKTTFFLLGFILLAASLEAPRALAQVTNTCAKFLTVNTSTTPSYYVQTNYWNSGSCPTTQCMTINAATGDFAVTAGNFNCGDNVATYPSIVYGCQVSGTCSPGTNLPMPVSLLQCVTSSWTIGVTNETGGDLWDAAYDIWFDQSNTNFNHTAELMIWMNYMAGTGPGGSFKASSVSIGNSPTLWTVYEGPVGWNYIAFLAQTPNITSFNDVDILAFINYCVAQGYIQSSWSLGAIEAGIEMRTGGVPFYSSGFNASVNSPNCGTPTFTPTFTPTDTPTPTPTDTPCGYPGNTCTPTFTPTPTNTPAVGDNIPWPNPWDGSQPISFLHTLSTPADSVALKVYTLSFRKIYENDGLATGQGEADDWQTTYGLSWSQLGNVANGLYYVVIEEKRGGQTSRSIMKVLVRR